jgi:hypothetical protein
MIRGYGFLSILPVRYGKTNFDIIDERMRQKILLNIFKRQKFNIDIEFKFYHYGNV